jgi:hypothetical protein
MKRFLFLLIAALLIMTQTGISNAQTFETFLNAGASTVQAGFDIYHTMDQGYLRTGLSGIYTDYENGGFESLDVPVAIGGDVLVEGLNGELGLKGLIGSVDKGSGNSDLGSLAFMIGGAYQLPKKLIPLTTKIFAEMTLTPSPLAFMDMDQYFEFKTGIDVFIVEKAALEFCYQHYDMKMKGSPESWTYEDDIVTIGIKLKF